MTVRLQEDARGEVPASVGTVGRAPSDGVRRLVESLRPLDREERGLLGEAGVVHSLDVDLPLRSPCSTVTTVHDLSVFDVAWAHSRARAAAERMIVSQAIRSADAIIAVSDFTAASVAERFGRTAVVTRLAPSSDMTPPSDDAIEDVVARFELPDRFVLHVGTIEPRKDVPRLAVACDRLGVPLVLAGRPDHDVSLVGDVRRLGYVERRDLPALYAAASVVAYPSVYEGFGLPPIEAMACGAAVVATAVGALPELAAEARPGDERLALCPPGDTDALAEALRATLDDDLHAAAQRRAARAIVGRLSWATTAERTLDVYRSVAGRPRHRAVRGERV